MTRKDEFSPEDFITKLDAGEFDGKLNAEISKLAHEHLERVAYLLMERDQKARERSTSAGES